jgi:hypothetical protein
MLTSFFLRGIFVASHKQSSHGGCLILHAAREHKGQRDVPQLGSKEMANMGLLARCQGMEAEEGSWAILQPKRGRRKRGRRVKVGSGQETNKLG